MTIFFHGGITVSNNNFIHEYGKYTMDKFEFENGKTLQNVDVEYLIKGNPKYDEFGNITNVLVFCHGYQGSCLSINELHQFTDEGQPFDFNDFLIVSIASLGFPESCCPSSSGLYQDFPEYTFKDKVNFKKQFIKEKLAIEKMRGVFGVGMGGHEVYTWACEYPDDMEFIIVGNSSYKTAGYRYIMVRGIKSVIESNPNFALGSYDESLSNTMIAVYQLIFSTYFSQKLLQKMSNDEIDVFMESFTEKSFSIDVYDLKFQYDALIGFDLTDQLSNIKAKTLAVSPKDDLYFSYEFDVLPLTKLIDDCQIEFIDIKRNKYDEMDFSQAMEVFYSFVEEFTN